jgi:hypothetical protein
VLRAAANASDQTPLATARQLATQLLQALPECARAAAEAVAAGWLLQPTDGAAVRALDDPTLDRAATQAALIAWFTRVCRSHALVLAVDDVQRVDAASIALLASLALEAGEHRLLIAATAEGTISEVNAAAFALLAPHCLRSSLRALSRQETQTLLVSIFDDVPRLAVLADRLHTIALGNPRETLALAQHLVDHGSVRYRDGRWSLPEELDASALPASAADAFAARVAGLAQLARCLAESHALLGACTLRRRDYAVLAGDAPARELDAAISELVSCEVVQSDGEFYWLSHRALADALCEQLDGAKAPQRHLALYELYRREPNAHPYLLVPHLLAAGRHEQAFDLLAGVAELPDERNLEAALRIGPARLAATLERALELLASSERPLRHSYELRRRLCSLAIYGSLALHSRFGPDWLEQLERDSGLCDYLALDPGMPQHERLQQALGAAAARYAATPEQLRICRVDEAIKDLVVYATTSMVVSMRTLDMGLLASLPGLLEPFAVLSPALFALWQNILAMDESSRRGRILQARRRLCDVYERIAKLSAAEVRYGERVRYGVAFTIGQFEVRLGRNHALEWAAILDADPGQKLAALQLRRNLCLLQGNSDGAAHFERESERIALRTGAQPPERIWSVELAAGALNRDLAGIKRVVDGIESLAAQSPGWQPTLHVARGHFQLLRGDVEAAHAAYVQALELTAPQFDHGNCYMDPWASAVTGVVETLTKLGRAAAAVEVGERALGLCEQREVELHWHRIGRVLALAHAACEQTERAIALIESVLDDQVRVGVSGLALAASYEARASIAVGTRDASAAAHYVGLAMRERRAGNPRAAGVQIEPLIEQAKRAGLALELEPTDFEASVLGASSSQAPQAETTRVREALDGVASRSQRTTRALELLGELAGAEGGHLYLVDEDAELVLTASCDSAAPDAEAQHFARAFFAQQIDDEELSAGLTRATHMLSLPGVAAYFDGAGQEHRVIVLSCKQRRTLCYVGLAVLRVRAGSRIDAELAPQSSAIAACLLAAGDSAGRQRG